MATGISTGTSIPNLCRHRLIDLIKKT